MNSATQHTLPIVPPLWNHQIDAIKRASNRFALFFDPGCGKTRTAIELYKKSCDVNSKGERIPRKVVILAPLNVCRNWGNELKEYLGQDHTVFLVSGQTKAKKLKILQQFKEQILVKPTFLICNIETLRGSAYREILNKCGASMIIVDESHNFRAYNSLQTKGLLDLVRNVRPEYLYLLTGTPAPQGEIDLWSTFTLLGKNSDNFFIWRKKFFDDKNERRRGMANYWPEYVVKQSTKEYFKRLLGECSVTARKNEVLDLPPLLRTNIYAELSPEQRRYYETMTEFLFAIDEDGNELNAANLLSRTLRLQQIIAGHLGEVAIADNPRLEALSDAIEKTNNEQFIIWTIFKATYGQIAAKLDDLGISYGMLTGEQTADERFDAMGRFQAGELKALIAHPRAGGVGVNLTAASYSIHYTRNYSLVDDLQAEARNYRGGSERHNRITRIDIIAPDTIDEEITEALREKKSVQDFILGLKEKHGREGQRQHVA